MTPPNEPAKPTTSKGSRIVLILDDDCYESHYFETIKFEFASIGGTVYLANGFGRVVSVLRHEIGLVQNAVCMTIPEIIILDLMFDTERSLRIYFPWVNEINSHTSFDAGLVFLETVLLPEVRSSNDALFHRFDKIPLVINSRRHLTAAELERVDIIRRRRQRFGVHGGIFITTKGQPSHLMAVIRQIFASGEIYK